MPNLIMIKYHPRGYGSVVERDLPKVEIRVRFSLPAPASKYTTPFHDIINNIDYTASLFLLCSENRQIFTGPNKIC